MLKNIVLGKKMPKIYKLKSGSVSLVPELGIKLVKKASDVRQNTLET